MKLLLLLLVGLSCVAATAQTITHGSIDLTDPEDPDWKSSYPLFTSTTNPRAAEAINMALQMQDHGKTITRKNPNAIKRTGQSPYVWNFNVSRPSDKLIEVTTVKTTLAFGMQSSPYETVYVYHFDANTGDRLYPSSFFTPGQFRHAQDFAMGGLLKAMRENKQQLIKENADTPVDELFDPTFDEDCEKQLMTEFENETVRLHLSKDAITFIVNDCENYIPRRKHTTYSTKVSVEKLSGHLSDTWKYYFKNMPKPPIEEYEHFWRGTLGTNIPVTLMIRKSPGSQYYDGLEVYDNYGTTIKLQGVLSNDGSSLLIDEMDDNKVLGSYELKVQSGILVGTWTKADKSKTFTFKASPPR